MIKYKKPLLIELDKLETTYGACANGGHNIEWCINGSVVIPGCRKGGVPLVRTK